MTAARPSYDGLLALRTRAIRARALADRTGIPALIAAAELAEAAFDAAVDGAVGTLDARVPLVLLPVRIETRYRRSGGGPELLVRVYPEVDVEEHEAPLTPTEIDAGRTYWAATWTAADGATGDGDRLAAWTALTTRVGRLRATWVRRVLTPTNPRTPGATPTFPAVLTQPARWSRPRRAVLQPDRWVVHALRGGSVLARANGPLVVRPLPAGPDPAAQPRPGEPTDDGMLWMVDFDAAVRAGTGIVLALPDEDPIDLLVVTGVRATEDPAASAAALEAVLTGHRHHAGLDLVAPGTPTNNTDENRSGHGSTDPLDVAELRLAEAGPRVVAGDGSDADVLAAALGIPLTPLSDLGGSPRRGVAGQADLAAALWPGSWGYYLTRMLRFNEVDDQLEPWRRWTVDTVRPGGPLPALRVGDQPYGVLPVTAMTRWRPHQDRGNVVVATLVGTRRRRTDLTVLGQLDSRGAYSFSASLGAVDTPANATAVSLAYRDRDGDRHVQLIVAHAGTAVLDGNRTPVLDCPLFDVVDDGRKGPSLVKAGAVAVPMPDASKAVGAPLSVGIACGTLTGARVHGPDGPGGTDVVVVAALPGRGGPQQVSLYLGRGVGRDGHVSGGWAPPVDVTASFDPAERILGAELITNPRSGGVDLIVVSTTVPADQPAAAGSTPLVYRVARGLTPDGGLVEGFSAPEPFGPKADDAILFGAGVGVSQEASDDVQLILGSYSGLAGGGWLGTYQSGVFTDAGTLDRWREAAIHSGDSAPQVLRGVAMAFARWLPVSSPQLGLHGAAARINLLRALMETWRSALPRVAFVHPADGTPGRTLLDILTAGDVSIAYQARPFVGPLVRDALRTLTGGHTGGAPAWAAIQPLLQRWGLNAPRLPMLGAGGFATAAVDLPIPLVASETHQPDHTVPWMAELAEATPADLHRGWGEPDTPILARLVRHSLLQAYADAALALVPVPADPPPLPEPELVDLADLTQRDPVTPHTLTSWRHLMEASLRGVPLADVVYKASRTLPAPPEVRAAAEAVAAVRRLAALTAAELTRLTAVTLDAAGHRLDAWVTAVATDRLRALRAQAPSGVHVGGYGYVRDLRPAAAASPTTGYVHAPSAAHAVTAGVLRSGYLTHDGQALGIDLSSGRVRLGLEVLDAVREGQSLAAVLGYRFESELQRAGLAQYLPAFRHLVPEAVGVLTPHPAGTPASAAAGLLTVDGLELLKLADADQITWGATPSGQSQALPQRGTREHAATVAVLARLRDGADAVADLGLAEAVHQTVQRNHLRAGGSLDALARGELPPPEPEVVRSPRTGTGVTHRVLMVAPDPGEPLAAAALGVWIATAAQRARHVRAVAEPRLNAWAALALGDPSRVHWRVGYRDPSTGASTGYQEEFTLAALGLCPLDVLAASPANVADLAQTDLGARLRRHVALLPPKAGRTAVPEFLLDRDPTWPASVLTLPDLLTLAEALRAVVAAGREGTAADLGPSGTRADPAVDTGELDGRAAAATASLTAALAALRDTVSLDDAGRAAVAALFPTTYAAVPEKEELPSLADLPATCDLSVAVAALGLPEAAELETVRDALELLAAHGLPGVCPADVAGSSIESATVLAGQAREAVTLGRARLAQAAAATDPIAALAAIFGAGFRALPLFTVDSSGSAAPAVADGADDDVVSDWFEDVARAREPSGRLSDALLLAEAAGGAGGHWTVVQHPDDGWGWLGLPASAIGPAGIRAGGVAIEIAGLGAPPRHTVPPDKPMRLTPGPWAMLAVDTWVEVVPDDAEDTAIALHLDVPSNEAPQALLLAVHPDPDVPWDDPTVLDVVLETADLARIRMVDPDLVPVVGHLLPALLLAHNVGGDPAGDTVSTDLGS